jgi:hypothetical protein
MLDLKTNELCTQISVEKDPKRLMDLFEELLLHLGKKQNHSEFKVEVCQRPRAGGVRH